MPTAPAKTLLNLTSEVSLAACPACGFHCAAPFFDAGRQPAAAAPAATPEEARALPRHRLHFLRCVDCGHIFRESPARHTATGLAWNNIDFVSAALPADPVILENPPLSGLAAQTAARPPDLIVSRHCPEHLRHPLAFFETIAFAAGITGRAPRVYFEVPCADRILEAVATSSFHYERDSHFTSASFARLITRIPARLECMGHSADGTSLYALTEIALRDERTDRARQAKAFDSFAAASRHTLMLDLANLYFAGRELAVWSGGGETTAFLNLHHMDSQRFPLVVAHSEEGHVPGTGQKIQSCAVLRNRRLDVVLAPNGQHAVEAVQALKATQVCWGRTLIPCQGRLIDFTPEAAVSAPQFDALADLLLAAG